MLDNAGGALARLPRPLRVLAPLAFALSLASANWLLSRIARQPTQRILALASAPYVATGLGRLGWLAATRGRRGQLSAEIPDEQRARYWTIAALDVVKTVLKVFAARKNELWLYASVEAFTPTFSSICIQLKSHAPSEKPLDRRRGLATVALLAVLATSSFAARLVDGWGLLLAILGAAAEGARQYLLQSHAAEQGEDLDAEAMAELAGETGMRSLALFAVVYLALFPLGLHESALPYGIYRHKVYEHLWPAFACLGHVFLLLSTTSADPVSLSPMTAAYAGASAGAVALLVLIGTKTAESPPFLAFLVVILLALAAAAYQPSRLALDAEDGEEAFFSSASIHPLLRLAPVIPYFLLILTQFANPATVDIVIAHYDKPLPDFRSHLARVYTAPLVRQSRRRTIVYHKGNLTTTELWNGLAGVVRRGTDEVHLLPNYGREGGTYLEHLVARYEPSTSPHSSQLNPHRRALADHTLFLQPHMAWDWIAGGRLSYTLSPRTGFVALSVYHTNLCGKDSDQGAVYGGFRRVFEAVEGRECDDASEEDRVVQTWSGQFAVSRERVWRNSREVYERLRDLIEAPDDDPIHNDWSPSGPSTRSNPAFGHALERAWPLVFHCTDPLIARACGDDGSSAERCQCWGP